MQRVNAGSSAWVSVVFKDRQGVPSAPVAVTYRIDCLTSKRSIRGVTSIAPGGQAKLDIQLTATDTAIANRTNSVEVRRVTVVAPYETALDQVTGQYEFEVVNVPFA